MALTHVPVTGCFPNGYGQPGEYRAECAQHQWAVADGGFEAVEALVREHVREHPAVHCPSPPRRAATPDGGVRFVRSQMTHTVRHDGTHVYTGTCGLCPDRWSVFNSPEPVDELMHEHWVLAHAADYAEENYG